MGQVATDVLALYREMDEVQILDTLYEAGISEDAVRGNNLIELVNSLVELSVAWSTDGDMVDSGTLYGVAASAEDVGELKARLEAEIQFYQKLYEPDPENRFHIFLMRALRFTYDDQYFPTIVFTDKRKGGYGCADFTSRPNELVIDYIQGFTSIPARKQRELFGGPWYEVFMNRVLEAYKPLDELGVQLMLEIYHKRHILPRRVRDRYFEKHPCKYDYHRLSRGKQRVRDVLGVNG